MTIDEALDTISVREPGDLADAWKTTYPDKPCPHPPGYWAVVDDSGIEGGVVAYFVSEQLAFRYRIDLVNRLLNG